MYESPRSGLWLGGISYIGLGISAGGAKEAKTFYKHQTEQKTFSAD